MINTLKSIYKSVEPKNHQKEVMLSAKKELAKEVKEETYYSKEYLRVILSQLKFYVKDNMISNIIEIKDILKYFEELFDIEDASQILKI